MIASLLFTSSHRALQEAQEIFGGDFDFADFDADAYDQGEEEEEDQDEEGWDRPKKQTKRRQGRKSIFEIYEPSELESSHMTDQDNEIRSTDMPERFQVCVRVCLSMLLMLTLLIHCCHIIILALYHRKLSLKYLSTVKYWQHIVIDYNRVPFLLISTPSYS